MCDCSFSWYNSFLVEKTTKLTPAVNSSANLTTNSFHSESTCTKLMKRLGRLTPTGPIQYQPRAKVSSSIPSHKSPLAQKFPNYSRYSVGPVASTESQRRRLDDKKNESAFVEEEGGTKESGGGMESKSSEAGKLSAPPTSEGAGGGGGGGGGPTGPPTTSQTPATTGVPPFPRLPPLPSSSSSSSSTVATATSGGQSRAGLAIGVPAHHPSRSHQPFTTFGPSPPPSVQHQHQFLSPMHRGPDSSPSSTSQVLASSLPSSSFVTECCFLSEYLLPHWYIQWKF